MIALARRILPFPISVALFLLLCLPSRAASPAFLVKDINPIASTGSNPSAYTTLAGTLFFVADDGLHGQELWKSDGTAEGTRLVKDIVPGSISAYPTDLTILNGTLFFLVLNDPIGMAGGMLWRSDGTLAGTTPVGSGYTFPSRLRSMNGRLFFVARDPIHGQELWVSDGTDVGTRLVKDIAPGTTDAFDAGLGQFGTYFSQLVVVNGVLLFSAAGNGSGQELWRSDGTAGGTVEVKDILPGIESSMPLNMTNICGRLFFSASTPASGRELWASDGTPGGTVEVKDIYPGPLGAAPFGITGTCGRLFFSASTPASGRELWVSDGTPGGTVEVKDIYPGSAGALDTYDADGRLYPELVSVHGTAFFTANDGTGNYELWTSDGSAGGTLLIREINPGLAPALPILLKVVGGTVFFSADDGSSGYELWKSNGTAAGTTRLADIAPGNLGSRPRGFTIAGTHLFFTADDGSTGSELWALPLNAWLNTSTYLPVMGR